MLPIPIEAFQIKIIALILCVGLVLFGYTKKLNDFKASIAAIILGFYFIFFLPIYWFFSLFLLYLATGFATKQKNNRKKVSHKKGRSISNILSNLGPAIIFSTLYILDNQPAFYLAFLCSAACACSDTLASEIGQLSKSKPRLITTWEIVPTGTDGAISKLGLIAAFFGSAITALPAIFMSPQIIGIKFFIIGTIIGFIGCNIDSVVGAIHQRKGQVSNEMTNLIATFISAFLGLMAGFLFF